jgi:short-subunit dehydrogenase
VVRREWEGIPVDLRGRIGIVTGADSDPGRTIATVLADEQMSLMLLARPDARMHDFAEELADRHGIRCFAATVDVDDAAAVDRILMHVEQHLGPIDVVVSTIPGQLVEAVLPDMAARGRGHVIHVPPSEAVPVPEQVTSLTLESDDAENVLALLS